MVLLPFYLLFSVVMCFVGYLKYLPVGVPWWGRGQRDPWSLRGRTCIVMPFIIYDFNICGLKTKMLLFIAVISGTIYNQAKIVMVTGLTIL